jgi:hypothetical protein
MVMNVTGPSARPRSLTVAGIEINGTLIPFGFKMRPNQPITLVAELSGLLRGGDAEFTIQNSSGTVVYGPVKEGTGFFSTDVKVDTVAPSAVGVYTLIVKELIWLLPDNTRTSSFEVSLTPDQEPPPGGGGGIGGFFRDAKNLLVAGAVVAVVIAVAPTINAVGQGVARVGRK